MTRICGTWLTLIGLILVCLTGTARPQTPPEVTGDSTESLGQSPAGPGTATREAQPSTLPRRSQSFFRSPTGALLKSVAVPGWGQWSNGKKKKAVVYFAVETYFVSRALIWRQRAFDRLHEWEATRTADTDGDQQAFQEYDTARDRRNYFYWLTGFTIFISMFDAYADSHLLELERTRDKGDDFWGGSASLAPDDEYRLTLGWRF